MWLRIYFLEYTSFGTRMWQTHYGRKSFSSRRHEWVLETQMLEWGDEKWRYQCSTLSLSLGTVSLWFTSHYNGHNSSASHWKLLRALAAPPFSVSTAHHHAYEAKDQDAFMRALNFSVIYNLCNYRPQANPRGILVSEENSKWQCEDGI